MAPRPDHGDGVGDALPRDVRAPSHAPVRTATGSLRSGLMLADGAMPIVPVQAGPRSERMSPNRLEATTTSKRSGLSTKCAVRMSMWYLSSDVGIAGWPCFQPARPSRASLMAMPLDLVAEVRCFLGRLPGQLEGIAQHAVDALAGKDRLLDHRTRARCLQTCGRRPTSTRLRCSRAPRRNRCRPACGWPGGRARRASGAPAAD
jgi:hypothetical protein